MPNNKIQGGIKMYKEHLQFKIDFAKEGLKSKAESLKSIMERLLIRLENGNLKSINSLGEVQGLGAQVDCACMELRTLMNVLEELEAYEKIENKDQQGILEG